MWPHRMKGSSFTVKVCIYLHVHFHKLMAMCMDMYVLYTLCFKHGLVKRNCIRIVTFLCMHVYEKSE